jgi:hypothetical protein
MITDPQEAIIIIISADFGNPLVYAG